MQNVCKSHSGLMTDIENVKKEQDTMRVSLDKVKLAQASMQGKWAVIAVVGMALVSAIFKYAMP